MPMQDPGTLYIIVLLHRYKGNAKELKPITNLISSLFDKPTILIPGLRIDYFTSGSTVPLINATLKNIDNAYSNAQRDYSGKTIKLILLGHSLGGLFAPKIYVCACGSNDGAPLERGIDAQKHPRPWAPHVERVVLLAGMNNGWAIDYHTKFGTALQMSFGVVFGNLLSYIHRKFPNAAFSFVGHSNGTFLVAKAFRDDEACRFHNVLFVGSVVNRNYNWRKYIQEGRIENIYNSAASYNCVVGIFTQSLHGLFNDL